MQFEPGTWRTEAVNAPGDPPGRLPNVYDEADAVYSVARYLRDSGMTPQPLQLAQRDLQLQPLGQGPLLVGTGAKPARAAA